MVNNKPAAAAAKVAKPASAPKAAPAKPAATKAAVAKPAAAAAKTAKPAAAAAKTAKPAAKVAVVAASTGKPAAATKPVAPATKSAAAKSAAAPAPAAKVAVVKGKAAAKPAAAGPVKAVNKAKPAAAAPAKPAAKGKAAAKPAPAPAAKVAVVKGAAGKVARGAKAAGAPVEDAKQPRVRRVIESHAGGALLQPPRVVTTIREVINGGIEELASESKQIVREYNRNAAVLTEGIISEVVVEKDEAGNDVEVVQRREITDADREQITARQAEIEAADLELHRLNTSAAAREHIRMSKDVGPVVTAAMSHVVNCMILHAAAQVEPSETASSAISVSHLFSGPVHEAPMYDMWSQTAAWQEHARAHSDATTRALVKQVALDACKEQSRKYARGAQIAETKTTDETASDIVEAAIGADVELEQAPLDASAKLFLTSVSNQCGLTLQQTYGATRAFRLELKLKHVICKVIRDLINTIASDIQIILELGGSKTATRATIEAILQMRLRAGDTRSYTFVDAQETDPAAEAAEKAAREAAKASGKPRANVKKADLPKRDCKEVDVTITHDDQFAELLGFIDNAVSSMSSESETKRQAKREARAAAGDAGDDGEAADDSE